MISPALPCPEVLELIRAEPERSRLLVLRVIIPALAVPVVLELIAAPPDRLRLLAVKTIFPAFPTAPRFTWLEIPL